MVKWFTEPVWPKQRSSDSQQSGRDKYSTNTTIKFDKIIAQMKKAVKRNYMLIRRRGAATGDITLNYPNQEYSLYHLAHFNPVPPGCLRLIEGIIRTFEETVLSVVY
jgi:hypothetical protein